MEAMAGRLRLALAAGGLGLLALGAATTASAAITVTFNYTGAAQTFLVPAGVTSITVDAFGAQGGGGGSFAPGVGGAGGLGGEAQATFSVVPGTNYQINVGGQGGAIGAGSSLGGGGGGASDLRTGADTLSDRVIVAGGGGGGGGATSAAGGAGGSGGGTTGGDGGGSSCGSGGGGGGTQSAGGAGGTGNLPGHPGSLGQGGTPFQIGGGSGGFNGGAEGGNASIRAGGGGGGYYGGGGGDDSCPASGGGGGGSGFTPGGTGMTNGVRSGHGQVTITYTVTPTLTTSASAGVVIGAQVHDTATLSNGSAPTGSITFKLYGPNDSTCANTPAFTSSAVSVSGNGSYDSPNFTPTAAGTYRWTASYSGDSNNNAVPTACNDANESVVVSAASPTISTNASAGVTLGGSVDDTAVFSGGFSMTGAIAFNLYGPNDSSCSGSPAFTSSGFMVPGQTEYGSGSFQPAAPGTYRWTVSYSGDSNNEAAASICNAANETVVISPAGTTLTTTASAGVVIGGSVHDTATVAGGVSPSGSITFKLYGPNDATCSGSPAFSSAVSVSGNGSYDSPTFTPTSAGTYRWTASYTGDGNNTPVAAVCTLANESVVISKASPTLSLKAIAKVASSIGATGTLGGGHSAAGQITFDLYGPGGDCSGTPIFTDTVSVSDNGAYTSKTFAPTKAGSYSWSASYSGDQNNEQALAPCTGPEASFSICVIPKVKGLPLAKAKRKITDASCATGKITRAFSRRIEKGKILWQRWTKPGRPRPGGTPVHLVVSKGTP